MLFSVQWVRSIFTRNRPKIGAWNMYICIVADSAIHCFTIILSLYSDNLITQRHDNEDRPNQERQVT